MIPREILKKIRQIEIRTNRLVKISAAVFRFLWITARVVYGQNHDSFSFNQKVNHKRKATKDYRAPDFTAYFWKPFWIACNSLKLLFNYCAKFLAQTFVYLFVEGNGVVEFLFRNTTKDKAPFHLRYLASNFAFTSSNEITSLGLLRCSCKRRSINSASPGVNSFDSAMSSQRLRHNSICSANESVRASFKIDSEFMELNLMVVKLFASA